MSHQKNYTRGADIEGQMGSRVGRYGDTHRSTAQKIHKNSRADKRVSSALIKIGKERILLKCTP